MSERQPRANRTKPKLEAETALPTEFGTFRLLVYTSEDPDAFPTLSSEHIALVKGHVAGEEGVAVRLHSECLTGEVFASLKCDCRAQLVEAQRYMQSQTHGVIVYLRQEGRGIGLSNKIRAYALQEQGADTVEANEQLDLPVDARNYEVAADILRDLDVRSIRLLTNNPRKMTALEQAGVPVLDRVALVVEANPHSRHYLDVKRQRMDHLLPKGNSPPSRSGED